MIQDKTKTDYTSSFGYTFRFLNLQSQLCSRFIVNITDCDSIEPLTDSLQISTAVKNVGNRNEPRCNHKQFKFPRSGYWTIFSFLFNLFKKNSSNKRCSLLNVHWRWILKNKKTLWKIGAEPNCVNHRRDKEGNFLNRACEDFPNVGQKMDCCPPKIYLSHTSFTSQRSKNVDKHVFWLCRI